jgi:choline dehydrogenase-like flavoprotein
VRILATAALALLAGCSAADPRWPEGNPETLRPCHDALFETVFPANSLLVDPALKREAQRVREGAWDRFRLDPKILGALARLDTFFGEPAWSLRRAEERDALLGALPLSPDNDTRRLAQQLRILYLSTLYADPLGPALAGIRVPPVEHPGLEDFLKAKTPSFPAGRAVYDAAKREVRPEAGTFDYIVVGSGPAGSALSFELRRKGKSVLLLEAGPFVLPGALDARVVPELFDGGGRRASSDGGIFFRSGRVVGGGTTVNIDLAFAPTLPIIRGKIEEWRAAGRIGKDDFSADEVARAYDWVKTKIGTRVVPESEINENNRILWDGAKELGLHPKLYELNTYPPGASPSPVTDKRSAVRGLLLEAMTDAANPLILVPDAAVRRVVIDGTDARGVEFEQGFPWKGPGVIPDPFHLGIPAGTLVRAEARRVVLCAGAIGSPAILLRSGLRNPLIGAGLVAHPSMPVIGRFDRPINVLEGTPASVYVDDYVADRGILLESMAEEPKYGAVMIPESGPDLVETIMAFSRLGGFGVLLIDSARNENRVRLDAKGDPVIDYALDVVDRRRFAFGVAQAMRILFQAGARRVWVPTQQAFIDATGKPLGRSFFVDASEADLVERQFRFLPNQCMVTSSHVQGTNKMGSGEATGVVSPGFQVWGTGNLYVVDASVFPTSIGANPMQSLYTLGRLAADRLEP